VSSGPESVLTVPTTSRAPWAWAAVVLVAVVAAILYFSRASSDPKGTPPPTGEAPHEGPRLDAAIAPAAVDAATSTSEDAETKVAIAGDASPPDAALPEDASSQEAGKADPSPARAKTGLLVPEGAPKGWRIFVDGRAVGETPSEVPAPCGTHEVRVGSKGTARTIDIPCGGRVVVGP
jgi:hypothetical protein